MSEKIKKFEELLMDSKKGERIIGETLEETRKNLADEGLELTIEELDDILNNIIEDVVNENVELNEKELERISGGNEYIRTMYIKIMRLFL